MEPATVAVASMEQADPALENKASCSAPENNALVFDDLPDDCLRAVINSGTLSRHAIGVAAQVRKRWRNVADSNFVWMEYCTLLCRVMPRALARTPRCRADLSQLWTEATASAEAALLQCDEIGVLYNQPVMGIIFKRSPFSEFLADEAIVKLEKFVQSRGTHAYRDWSVSWFRRFASEVLQCESLKQECNPLPQSTRW